MLHRYPESRVSWLLYYYITS